MINTNLDEWNRLAAIGEQLRTQDNLGTADPMFCVQIKVRDVGYDSGYTSGRCWYNPEEETAVYDDDKDFKEPKGDDWQESGYKDRWETVVVSFTRKVCEDYLFENGHNMRSRAHNEEVRIYADTFFRCREMILIRKALMEIGVPPVPSDDEEPITEEWLLKQGFQRTQSPMGPGYSDHFEKDMTNLWEFNGTGEWLWCGHNSVTMKTRGKLRSLMAWLGRPLP